MNVSLLMTARAVSRVLVVLHEGQCRGELSWLGMAQVFLDRFQALHLLVQGAERFALAAKFCLKFLALCFAQLTGQGALQTGNARLGTLGLLLFQGVAAGPVEKLR